MAFNAGRLNKMTWEARKEKESEDSLIDSHVNVEVIMRGHASQQGWEVASEKQKCSVSLPQVRKVVKKEEV